MKTLTRRELLALPLIAMMFVFVGATTIEAGHPDFVTHVIKPPRPGAQGNTVPSMVWLDDVNADGAVDLVASHIAWMNEPGYVHPYVAWYPGPEFRREHVMVNKDSFGPECRVYRFVMFDVDSDGRKDLIGQGYQPHSNLNHWYRCPDDPTRPWAECYDYGKDLKNGHDIRLRDNDNDVSGGHNCELVDVDGDGDEDLIVGGVDKRNNVQRFRWYERAHFSGRVHWKEHVFGRTSVPGFKPRHGFYCGEMAWGDMDGDGDVDFVYAGVGSGFLGWFENVGRAATEY